MEEPCNFLLVGHGIHGDNVIIHEISDNLIGLSKEQVAQRNSTYQVPLRIQHITDIDGLLIYTGSSYTLYGLSDGKVDL